MSDDAAAAPPVAAEPLEESKKKFKVLALVDGISIEPISSRDDDDDDDGDDGDDGDYGGGCYFYDTDEEGGSTGSTQPRRPTAAVDDDDGVRASRTPTWSCPRELSDGGTCDAPGRNSRCTHSSYGKNSAASTTNPEDRIGPDVDGGLVFTVKVLPNDYDRGGGEGLRFLRSRDYDPVARVPKPRRKMPFPVTVDDFYASVSRIGEPSEEDNDGGGPPRWLFAGVINGWPGLPMPLELLSIKGRDPSFLGRRRGWSKLWSRDEEGRIRGKDPSRCRAASEERGLQVKATLRAPPWSVRGWSRTSPGFLFWVEGQRVGAANPPLTVTYGTNLNSRFKCPEGEDPQITRVHMINHRYAAGKNGAESQKDKLTYHSLVLLEWDRRDRCSLVEIGLLNGLGGYRCRCNWYADKDAPESSLYAAFPPEMIMPWNETMGEIRVHDVPYPDLDSFLGFMKGHEGHGGRFVDASVSFSHDVRLTYRSRRNVATYLLNYIRRDCTYSEMRRNCQTFAADLCGFLAGKKDVHPYHPVNQIQYVSQKHKFLYESSGYQP